MKRLAAAVLLSLLLLSLLPTACAEETPAVSAQCAVVMHGGGEIVYEKNANQCALIASTTKIMTAIVSIENASLDETVQIRPDWPGVEGSSMYLVPGQQVTVRELLTGLLLVSGNDAALALAEHVSGSSDAFAEKMNEKARELRMESTHFENPHGLDAENHYSTARDMALLMEHCMQNETFREIICMKNADAAGQSLYNHNKLLSSCPGCIGGKTGYTMAAGRCLVSCCEREGTRFICVTLSAPDDWNDHKKLYDWAFAAYSDRTVRSDQLVFAIPVEGGTAAQVTAAPESDIRVFLPRSAEIEVKAEMPWFVFAPVIERTPAGKITVSYGDRVLAEEKLVYRDTVWSASLTDSDEVPALERILNTLRN